MFQNDSVQKKVLQQIYFENWSNRQNLLADILADLRTFFCEHLENVLLKFYFLNNSTFLAILSFEFVINTKNSP